MLRNLAPCGVWEEQESGLTELTPLISTSSLGGQDPVFSHLEGPQGSLQGVAVV